MMRSKATAALIKLKEMDRKYKMKCSVIEEEKSNSSISDISAIIDQVPNEPEPIANRRLKLDIRMPEAHMERGNQRGSQETESPLKLVTIFDKPGQNEAETPPRSGSSPQPSVARRQVEETNVAGENVQCPSALSSIKEEADKSETSISEDVSEVAPDDPVVEDNKSQETNSKSVASMMIEAEEVPKSDPASSVPAETYSDDFSRSSTDSKQVEGMRDGERKVESISHEVRRVKDTRNQHSSGSKDSEIVELVESPKTTSSDFGRSERMIPEAENPPQTTSRPSSSARSAKERRRSKKSRTASSGDSPSSSSSRNDPEVCINSSKSSGHNSTESTRPECENDKLETVSLHDSENTEENSKSCILKDEKVESVRVETVLPKGTIPRFKNRPSGKQKVRDCPVESKNRAKGAGNSKTRSRADSALIKQQIREHHLRSRVRSHVQQFMTEQEQRLWARCCTDGLYGCQGFDGATGLRPSRDDRQRLHSFFKPLDLPNVAAFKRPGKLVPPDWNSEEDETPNLDNERRLHLRRIRERILGIRQWLKQQFVLYRDYSTLVSAINAKYIPVTLKETKKMIHDMQQFCVSTAKNPVLS